MANDLSAIFDNLEADADREAIADLEPLFNAHEAKRFYERDMKTYDPSPSDYGKMGRVRRWLTDHPDESLVDQELGIRAWLQSGGTSDRYEAVLVIKEQNPAVYERLLLLGCLSVDGAKVKDAMSKGLLTKGDLEGYVMQQQKTPSLKLGRTKE